MPHKDPIERRAWQFRRNLRRRYDMPFEEYKRLFEENNGCCSLCGKNPKTQYKNFRLKPLAVDHDHATGRIRGLLCSHCNNNVLGGIEKIGIDKILSYLNEDRGIIGNGAIKKYL